MLKIEIDDKQVKKALKNLERKNAPLFIRISKLLGEAAVNNIVENKLSGQVLKRQSGTLAKSINYKVENKRVVVGTTVDYGAYWEFGFTRSRRIAGKRSRVVREKVKARPFVKPGIEEIFSNGTALRIMENELKSYLDKEFK